MGRWADRGGGGGGRGGGSMVASVWMDQSLVPQRASGQKVVLASWLADQSINQSMGRWAVGGRRKVKSGFSHYWFQFWFETVTNVLAAALLHKGEPAPHRKEVDGRPAGFVQCGETTGGETSAGRKEFLYILYFNIWFWTCWLAAKPKASATTVWDFWPNIFKYFLCVFSAASPDWTHPAGNECGFTRTHQHTVGWEPRMWEPRWPWARACLRMSVRPAYMPCCHKRSKVESGVKMSSTEQDGIQTLTPSSTHECMPTAKRSCTFNLPADLGQVSHPFEDLGVSCLICMRRLQRGGTHRDQELAFHRKHQQQLRHKYKITFSECVTV